MAARKSAVAATSKINLKEKQWLRMLHLWNNNAAIWETGLTGCWGSHPVHNTTCKSFNTPLCSPFTPVIMTINHSGPRCKGKNAKLKRREEKKQQKVWPPKVSKLDTLPTIGILCEPWSFACHYPTPPGFPQGIRKNSMWFSFTVLRRNLW